MTRAHPPSASLAVARHTSGRAPALALAAAFVAGVSVVALGCDMSTDYKIVPTYYGDQATTAAMPSPYLDVCELYGAACLSRAYCLGVSLSTGEEGSICTDPCQSNSDCDKFAPSANKMGCENIGTRSLCAVLCDASGACPNGLECRGRICVNVKKP